MVAFMLQFEWEVEKSGDLGFAGGADLLLIFVVLNSLLQFKFLKTLFYRATSFLSYSVLKMFLRLVKRNSKFQSYGM